MQQNWYVYLVRCADDTLYTGVARDVERRVSEHNGEGSRGARYTRARRPVTLCHVEIVETRSEACRREAAIKRMPRVKKEALVRGNESDENAFPQTGRVAAAATE